MKRTRKWPASSHEEESRALLADFLCAQQGKAHVASGPRGAGKDSRCFKNEELQKCPSDPFAHTTAHTFSPCKYQFKKSENLYCYRLGSWPFEGFLQYMNRPQIFTFNNPVGIALMIGGGTRQCRGFEQICISFERSDQIAENNPEENQVHEPQAQITVRVACGIIKGLLSPLRWFHQALGTLRAGIEKQCVLMPAVLPKAHVNKEGQEWGPLPSPDDTITGCVS